MNITMLKPSQRHSKVITKNKSKKQWITASAIISFILVLIGAATLVLVQKPIQESQDLRQQASVDSGDVVMTFSPTTGNTLNVNEEAQVTFQATTNSIQVDGLQLVFNVVTDTLGGAPEFVLTDSTNLQIAYQQAELVTDGYLVSIILIADQIANPVSYSSPSSIGYLRFTPESAGSVELNFDVENSISSVFNSNPPQDQLTHIEALNYTVVDPAQPSSSPSPSPSPTATVTVSPSPSPSPSAEVSPTPSTENNNTNGVGGSNQTVSCNESCSSNNDCAANHRCYNNQCRLVTNVSSSSCAPGSTADSGINRVCNEYCADNRECSSGYSCYFNRCRNPLNLDSTTCTQPSQQVISALYASCNQACATHKDCAANLLCNSASGTCRLATNPSSTTCTPSSNKSVSSIYSNKGGSKGGDTSSNGSSTASPVASAKASASPTASSIPSDSDEDLPIKDQTALSAMINYIQDRLAEFNISLPILFIIAGILLLLLVLVISMLSRMLGSSSNHPPIITPVDRDRDTKKDAKYENKLSEKINALQKEQKEIDAKPLPTTPTAQVSTQQINPTPTTSESKPTPVSVPSPLSPPPQAATSKPIAHQPQPSHNGSGSNMMDRLKNKGISTPKTDQDR